MRFQVILWEDIALDGPFNFLGFMLSPEQWQHNK